MEYSDQRRMYSHDLEESIRTNEVALPSHQVVTEQPRLLFGFEGTVVTIAPQNNLQQHVIQPHQHLTQMTPNVHQSYQPPLVTHETMINTNQLDLPAPANDMPECWCLICNRPIGNDNEQTLPIHQTEMSFSGRKLSTFLLHLMVDAEPMDDGSLCRPCFNHVDQADSFEMEFNRAKNHIQTQFEMTQTFRKPPKCVQQPDHNVKQEDYWEEQVESDVSEDLDDPDVTLLNLRGTKYRTTRTTTKKSNKSKLKTTSDEKIGTSSLTTKRGRGRPRKTDKTNEEIIPEGEATKECPICKKVVICGKYMYHLSTHRMFACPFCSEVHKRKDITEHMAKMHQSEPSFPCHDCDSSFNTFSQLSQHHTLFHFGEDIERHQCKLCNKTLASSSGLKVHIETIHSKVQLYECSVCKETFNQKGNMQSHVRRLHQDQQARKLQCDVCPKRFICPSDLRKHVERVHLKLRKNKVACELCVKSFSDSRALKVHINAVHTKDIEYPCPECKMVFHSLTNMVTHRRRMHSGLLGRKHVCQVCNKGFCSPSDLRTHLKVVHENIRKFICDICGQSFKVASHLKYHRRRHTGETPYKCPHCSKSFHGPSHIADHVKKVHKTVYLGVNQRRRLNLPEDTPPPPPGILPNKDHKVKNLLMPNVDISSIPGLGQMSHLQPTMQHSHPNVMPPQTNQMLAPMEHQNIMHNTYANQIQFDQNNTQPGVPMVVRLFPDINY